VNLLEAPETQRIPHALSDFAHATRASPEFTDALTPVFR
jgi:hypothetical protein